MVRIFIFPTATASTPKKNRNRDDGLAVVPTAGSNTPNLWEVTYLPTANMDEPVAVVVRSSSPTPIRLDVETDAHLLTLAVRAPLTEAQVGQICEELGRAFGAGHRFTPLSAPETGIDMVEWPGKTVDASKRLFVRGGSGWWSVATAAGAAPPSREKEKEKDRHGCQRQRSRRRSHPSEPYDRRRVRLFAKAVNGAPVWTPDEGHKVVRAFKRHAWELVGRVATVKALRTIRW